MLGFFERARIQKPHKRVWKNTRVFMRQNPGPQTQLLWKMAVFRLSSATSVVGYRFEIEDFANSTFNCVATLPSEKRAECASAIRALADAEPKTPENARYALARELVCSLVELVELRLAGDRSVATLLGLIEAGFRGAASSIRDQKNSYSTDLGTKTSKESSVRFQWSSLLDQENRANINLLVRTDESGAVSVTCPELPSFLVSFSSLDEAKAGLGPTLSGYLGKRMGGPAMIWTPDEWR